MGQEYPERPLMSVLSDLLGIAHFSTSNGSTVRRDFLEAVAVALGVPDPGRLRLKDDVLLACLAAATGRPQTKRLLSPGATVTDAALDTIINGVVEQRAQTMATPVLQPGTAHVGTAERIAGLFRAQVLEAYRGMCAVTSTDTESVLDVIRLASVSRGGPDLVSNALVLRLDIAHLWDLRQIRLHEDDYRVLAHKALSDSQYWLYAGDAAFLPVRDDLRPSRSVLRELRRETEL